MEFFGALMICIGFALIKPAVKQHRKNKLKQRPIEDIKEGRRFIALIIILIISGIYAVFMDF